MSTEIIQNIDTSSRIRSGGQTRIVQQATSTPASADSTTSMSNNSVRTHVAVSTLSNTKVKYEVDLTQLELQKLHQKLGELLR